MNVVTKTRNQVIEVIRKALDTTGSQITLESSADNVPEWDSLGQINIIVALDQEFGGAVSELPEMATAASVSEIMTILDARGLISH